MSLWLIPGSAAALLIGIYVWDKIAEARRASRCWSCDAKPGHAHARGCKAEARR